MRATTAIEGLDNGANSKSKGRSSNSKIVITELPYQVCKVCPVLIIFIGTMRVGAREKKFAFNSSG